MAEFQAPMQPRLTEEGAQMQLMILNEPFDGSFFAGQRPSGFFSSMGRQFRLQGGTVLDHWKGIADTSEVITPEQFTEIIGNRDVPMPDGTVTTNMAQRLSARYDREERERQYESNAGSIAGGLIGGIPPWVVSPEGVVGFLVPPVRMGQLAQATVKSVASRPSTLSIVGREAAAQIPASAVMGGTNILAQRAAYGEVDALEVALVLGAPIALGAGLGAIRAGKIQRAQAQRTASEMSDFVGPPKPITGAVETSVPPALVSSFAKWAGVQAADSTEVVFQKILQKMQAQGIPVDAMDNLVEAFARTSTKQLDSTPIPEVRQAIKDLLDADKIAVDKTAPATRARIVELDKKLAQAERRLEKAQKKVAETSRPIIVAKTSKAKATTRMPKEQAVAQKKALVEVKKQEKAVTALREERAGVKADPEGGVTIEQKHSAVRDAVNNLAAVIARQSDHPLPAEFVAEFLEVAGLRAKIHPDVVKSPKLQAEGGDTPTVTATTTKEQTIIDEIANDPAFKELVAQQGGEAAMKNFAKVDRIIKGCSI